MTLQKQKNDAQVPAEKTNSHPAAASARPKEKGGPAGPEPTRFGDWERNGKCVDF